MAYSSSGGTSASEFEAWPQPGGVDGTKNTAGDVIGSNTVDVAACLSNAEADDASPLAGKSGLDMVRTDNTSSIEGVRRELKPNELEALMQVRWS